MPSWLPAMMEGLGGLLDAPRGEDSTSTDPQAATESAGPAAWRALTSIPYFGTGLSTSDWLEGSEGNAGAGAMQASAGEGLFDDPSVETARAGIGPNLHRVQQGIEEQIYLMENGTAHIPSSRPDNGGDESVVYLGINSDSREEEKKAFASEKNATVITGSGTDEEMQGKIMAADGETVLDLSKEEDVKQFLRESGAGAVRMDENGDPMETTREAMARMGRLEDLFLGDKLESGERVGGIAEGSRDEMAQFVQLLQKVETGEMSMDRLVMSGHSTGQSLFGPDGRVELAEMQHLMKLFPNARDGVSDLMLSACHTLEDDYNTAGGQQYQDIFPNLSTMWGYDGFSPTAEQGSGYHIRRFLESSQGSNPQAVAAAARGTSSAATAKIYQANEDNAKP